MGSQIQRESHAKRAPQLHNRTGKIVEGPETTSSPSTVIASESEAIQLVSGEGRAGWFNTRVVQSQEQPNINWIASPSFAMTNRLQFDEASIL